MVECYYVILISILMYLIYINCTDNKEDFTVSLDNTLYRGIDASDTKVSYRTADGYPMVSSGIDASDTKVSYRTADGYPMVSSSIDAGGCVGNGCISSSGIDAGGCVGNGCISSSSGGGSSGNLLTKKEHGRHRYLMEKGIDNLTGKEKVEFVDLNVVSYLGEENGKKHCSTNNKSPVPTSFCYSSACKGVGCAQYEEENIKLNIPRRTKLKECITGNEDICRTLPCYGDLSKCMENNKNISIKENDLKPIMELHKSIGDYRRKKYEKTAKFRIRIPSWRRKRKNNGLKWKRGMVPYKEYP